MSDTKIRDELARVRTEMASERTFLSHVNTTIALVGLSVVVFRFVEHTLAFYGGILVLIVAGFVFSHGVYRYNEVASRFPLKKDSDGGELAYSRAPGPR